VDLAGLASVCLIVPWLLQRPSFSNRKHLLLICGLIGIVLLLWIIPNSSLASLSPIVRHILVFLYAIFAASIIWAVFKTAARGRTGIWWLRVLFVGGAFIFLILTPTSTAVWVLFTVLCAFVILTFRPLKQHSPWKLTLIFAISIAVSLILTSEASWRADQMIAQRESQSSAISTVLLATNLLNCARVFLVTAALILALRILLHGILGVYSKNIRVRTKLILTVLFSSIIPGVMVLFLVIYGGWVIAGGYCASLVCLRAPRCWKKPP
jgi:hypothetical protein